MSQTPSPTEPAAVPVARPTIGSAATVRPPGSAVGPVDARWVSEDVDRWLAEEPLTRVVEAFGGKIPDGAVERRLAYLEDFSAAHWEFRKGRERDFIENVRLPDDLGGVVLDAARALGMRGTTRPSRDRYDHVLVLGGLVRACLLRPRFAAALRADGVTSRTVTGLTAFRPLSDPERTLLGLAAPASAADNEMSVMTEGMLHAFDVSAPPTHVEGPEEDLGVGTWTVRRWNLADLALQVVVAPSPDPSRRANSADTYVFWADQVQHVGTGDSVLLVTSSIYVPYQGAEAVRVLGLPRGVLVETVGIDAKGPEFGTLRQEFHPAHYLQEIRSTVRAARGLYAASTGG